MASWKSAYYPVAAKTMPSVSFSTLLTSGYSGLRVMITEKSSVGQESVISNDDTFLALEGDDGASNNHWTNDVPNWIAFRGHLFNKHLKPF